MAQKESKDSLPAKKCRIKRFSSEERMARARRDCEVITGHPTLSLSFGPKKTEKTAE